MSAGDRTLTAREASAVVNEAIWIRLYANLWRLPILAAGRRYRAQQVERAEEGVERAEKGVREAHAALESAHRYLVRMRADAESNRPVPEFVQDKDGTADIIWHEATS